MNKVQLRSAPKHRSPLAFFLMAAAIYIPFAIYANVQVFPNWTLFNFAAFIPMLVALILVYREEGAAGMAALLTRTFDFKRIKAKIWYLPIFLLIPFTVLVQYGYAFSLGLPISSPHFETWWLLLFVIMFIAAMGEELGWMGYLFDPLQDRFGALKASILLGVIWALIHIPLFTSSSVSSYWIVWQLIYIAATRVLFVWVYNNSGKSVFAVTIMHALFNSVWLLFPRNQEWVGLVRPVFYNPVDLAFFTLVLATIVTFLWGSNTLAQYKFTQSNAEEPSNAMN